jgi:hypothetical protein
MLINLALSVNSLNQPSPRQTSVPVKNEYDGLAVAFRFNDAAVRALSGNSARTMIGALPVLQRSARRSGARVSKHDEVPKQGGAWRAGTPDRSAAWIARVKGSAPCLKITFCDIQAAARPRCQLPQAQDLLAFPWLPLQQDQPDLCRARSGPIGVLRLDHTGAISGFFAGPSEQGLERL